MATIDEFEHYFDEMNKRAHDAMSASEPENALVFLKQVEEFRRKIERAPAIIKKSFLVLKSHRSNNPKDDLLMSNSGLG